MKLLSYLTVILFLGACNTSTYKDLNVNKDNAAQVKVIMGEPDAIESSMEEGNTLQIWHYYDLALDLELRNDTLRVIYETNGMSALPGKAGAMGELAH